MISPALLKIVGIVFAVAALVAAGVWLASAVRNLMGERRLSRHRPTALAEVARVLRGADPQKALELLGPLGANGSVSLLIEMTGAVGGAQRLRLDQLAAEAGLLDKAHRWSRSRRWSRRLRAARLVACFGTPGDRVGEQLLSDPNPDVRAEAALWAGRHRDPRALRLLVDLLEDPAPRCRFNAAEALRRAGAAAVPALSTRLAREPAPSPRTIEVARSLAVPDFHADAVRLTTSSDPAIRAAAAGLVAAIGGPAAATHLEQMLLDPEPSVRAAAVTGCGVLARWESAAPVADLLDDGSWAVRRAAAESLQKLGPTGELFLRQSGRGSAGEGVRAARSVLGLPPDPALVSSATGGAG